MPSLRLFLGGLDLAITADEEILPPEGEAYLPFLSAPVRAASPAIPVRVVVTETPRVEGQLIFESDAAWSILKKGARRTVVDRDGSRALLAVHFELGEREIRIECSPDWLADGPRRAIRCPVRYPVDQILAMYLLGRQGLVLHAAGMRVRGQVVVLPGVSGAGKTTLCGLARDREGWEGLSDDRVIVRVPDGGTGAEAHGTPWPGEGRIASNRERPGRVPRPPLAGVPKLPGDPGARRGRPASARGDVDSLVRSDDLGPSLEACDRLVSRVPAFLLTFRPDPGAVDLVERLLERGGRRLIPWRLSDSRTAVSLSDTPGRDQAHGRASRHLTSSSDSTP